MTKKKRKPLKKSLPRLFRTKREPSKFLAKLKSKKINIRELLKIRYKPFTMDNLTI